MAQWESQMADFIPETMIQVDLLAKSDEVFCHDVTYPQMIRGAYFIGSNSDSVANADFFILDGDRRVVFSRRKKPEGIFAVNATKGGQYLLVFSNLKSKNDKRLTVAFGTKDLRPVEESQAPTIAEDYLKDEELRDVLKSLKDIQFSIGNMQTEQRMSNIRQDSHNQNVEENNKANWWVSAFEAILFLCFAGFQVWYIENMLDNKRILL